MSTETHSQLANFIWSICNLLRGPYKRNEYRKVILPLTVLRRFDCLLAPTKTKVLAEHPKIKAKPETVVRSLLEKITGRPFYNLSKLDLPKLLNDPNQLAPNINAYINGYSRNVREIMERFAFDQQITRMAGKNLLYGVVKKFAAVNLSPERADNVQMGYVFEELIRIGAEQSNEEAGEHFTPREVIRLMVNLLLAPERDLRKSHVVKTIYDPACGTGGAIVARSVGVSYPAVNASEIGTLPIPLPAADEQRAIADFLDRETAKIDTLVAKIETAIERLQEYRTVLITAAVTGKIDVRPADVGVTGGQS